MPPDIFDTWAAAHSRPANATPTQDTAQTSDNNAEESPSRTPLLLRRALQQLVKEGVLEVASKPQLFKQITLDTALVNQLLEPLDLAVQVDDARGIAFVRVAPSYLPEDDEGDAWTHPLVRRLPLTLEQSLLLAILRREFLQREQEGGIGAPVHIAFDSLLPQLEIYLDSSGSDMQDRKRLTHLLDKLHDHGIVSRPDAHERLTIRPLIVHLANPENLAALLQHLQSLPRKNNE